LKEPPKRARKTGADGRTFKYLFKDYAMRHSHTSRISAKTILAFVGLGLAGACSDSVSSPATHVVAVKAPAGYDQVLGAISFVYDPTATTVARLGNNLIVIPANGICDLSSSYGPGTWDDPCAPLTHSIVITVTTFADSNGSPYVDFQPALRFDPNTETDLYLKDGWRDGQEKTTINYCSVLDCVDESINDSSLVTQRIGNSSTLVRRIKHFSGYNIVQGDPCNGTISQTDDGSLWCDDGSGLSRSGYMLASGLNKTDGASTGTPRRKKPIQ
jgi:hypothetical protein